MFTRIIFIISLSVSFSYADQLKQAEYKEGEVFIRFAPKEKGKLRALSEKQSFLRSKLNNAKIKRQYDLISDLTLVELPTGVKVADAVKNLKNNPDILYIEPNYKIYLMSTFPNDTQFSSLWGMHNTGQSFITEDGLTDSGTPDADIDAPEAWDIHTDASNITVAVLDTGIDYNHPDLAANMWVNQAELIGDPNYDDDGNGYKDDIYGYDFADQDSDPNDYMFHGTHVAGTIGAVGDNGIGVAGVCWDVKLMSVKIFPNYGEEAFISHAIEGIHYAVNNGAKVLNNSWGGKIYSQTLKDTIAQIESQGILFIVAAGNYRQGEWTLDNDIDPAYPASYDLDNIISVLATDCRDEMPWWSHYGATTVDIGAPGLDVFSTFPTYLTNYIMAYGFSTYYQTIGGTSMAAPHVSGACALVWSMYPHLKMSEVKQIILDSADKLPALNGLCVTEGRLNVYQALLHAHPLGLELEDDISDPNGCVVPEDEITFTISYGNPSTTNSNDPNYFGPAAYVEIRFPLPIEVDYANINDPNYNPWTRTYIWDIGTLNPGDSNSVSLTVTVNQNAEPLGEILSKVKMYSSIGYGEANEKTRVCSWGGDRIYVDAFANGPAQTGVSWTNAYKDLQKALQRARQSCGNEIWVARGIYMPTKTQNRMVSFDMVDGVKIYGGFSGTEDSLNNRNYVVNKTYLSGNIDIGGDEDSFVVVNTEPASSITNTTVLDGFIIAHTTVSGIYCNQADLTIRNCVITDNDANGIDCYKSNPVVYDSVIIKNGACGVYDCNESSVTVEGCIIAKNEGTGVYCTRNAAAILKNNWIHNNKADGVAFNNAASGSLIRNNTILYNGRYGIYVQQGNVPTVRNCIIWDNTTGDIAGCGATYSCFDAGYQGTGNIYSDPCFAYSDLNAFNFHLHVNSPCRDAGDSGNYPNEYDIDGEPRVYGIKADMGADEVYSCDGVLTEDDICKATDWNSDGLINYAEFTYFSRAWISHDPNDPAVADPNHPDYIGDPNDPRYIDPDQPAWNPMCNFNTQYDSEYAIDLADLMDFCNNWTWKACWKRFDIWMFTLGNIDGDTDDMYEAQSTTAMMMNNYSMPQTALQSEPVLEETQPVQAVEPLVVQQVEPVQQAVEPAQPEKSIEEQIADLQEAIQFLESIGNDPNTQGEIQAEDWQLFMESVRQSLNELEQADTAAQETTEP